MKMQLIVGSLMMLVYACTGNSQTEKVPPLGYEEFRRDTISDEQVITTKLEEVVDMLFNSGDTLVVVDYFNKDIRWDLKYATTDNFMKRVLYDTLQKVYVQIDVARRLAKCQDELTKLKSGHFLLVYDGMRPLSVQWDMWNALDTIPVEERGKFVSNPANGSVHNYGAAVDITICNEAGEPLDMGAGYDDIRKIAYPSLEQQFLASGELKKEQVDNRKLLRRVMQAQGFMNIPSEWWHFNAYSRPEAKKRYQLVRNELAE